MLTVNIICVGKIKEKYWTQAIEEYQKRLRAFCKFNIIETDEIRAPLNPKPSDIEAVLKGEGQRIISKLSKGSRVIALCIEGDMLSSEKLAQTLDNIALFGGSTVDFVIGGSFGLSPQVKQRADIKLSMSPMTFPHQMARVILCEQIYRAFEIQTNGKYHK